MPAGAVADIAPEGALHPSRRGRLVGNEFEDGEEVCIGAGHGMVPFRSDVGPFVSMTARGSQLQPRSKVEE